MENKCRVLFEEIKIVSEPIDVIGKIGAYVSFFAKVEVNDPFYQWYDKNGKIMPRMCRNTLAIGPIEEEDFGFYQLHVSERYTGETASTRWVELKRVQPVKTQSDLSTHQQVEPKKIRKPIPQHNPVQNKETVLQQQKKYYPHHQQQQQHSMPKLLIEPNIPPQSFPVQARKEFISCQTQQLTPKLLMQPEGGAYSRGSRITLTAHFENATHYQWYKEQEKLEGCVGNTLFISDVGEWNTGSYCLYASNNFALEHTNVNIIVY